MGGRSLRCGNRRLALDRTRVMGVLNITPDSFSDGGQLFRSGALDLGALRVGAEAMCAAGVDIIDVGGESTRPGANPVTVDEELRRVMPVVESLLELDSIVSVDTRKAEVAEAALAAGCHMINDVGGLADERMLAAVAESSAAVCIMHMQGTPATMQQDPRYKDVIGEVRQVLETRSRQALAAGVDAERICVDPGFGFGKTLEHNLTLLQNLAQLRVDGLALLVGLSRKRMIGALANRPVESRMAASVAAAVLAAERGADIVRVHDVPETVDALKILEAVRQ